MGIGGDRGEDGGGEGGQGGGVQSVVCDDGVCMECSGGGGGHIQHVCTGDGHSCMKGSEEPSGRRKEMCRTLEHQRTPGVKILSSMRHTPPFHMLGK